MLQPSGVAAVYTWHSFRSGLATALFAAGVPDATIQLMCRWMCPESLHVYRRLGMAGNHENLRKAARADVSLIQSTSVCRIDNDQAFAGLLGRQAPQQGPNMEQEFDAARHAARAPGPGAASPRPDRPDPEGRRVLVPRELWPAYPCNEQDGRGWAAAVRSTTQSTAVVRFIHARTLDGRPYADERVPLEMLRDL